MLTFSLMVKTSYRVYLQILSNHLKLSLMKLRSHLQSKTILYVNPYMQPEQSNHSIKNHPLGRIAVPDDYKGTVLYLASDASSFVTGEMIVVDGGKTAK